MQYKFAKEQHKYSDLSSGRVFYSLPGHPAFPVRLASEVFQRCLAQRAALYGKTDPCTLYDPCCGAAYHLSVLAYLHGEHMQRVIASDIDEKAVALAQRNLALLHADGLEKRIHEISGMLEQYGKESHREALHSAFVLQERLSALRAQTSLETRVFQASATDRKALASHIPPRTVDIVFTDVPYGSHSRWRELNLHDRTDPLNSMLDALQEIVSPASIVAIVSDKGQKPAHEAYRRLEHFQVGKRRIVLLTPV